MKWKSTNIYYLMGVMLPLLIAAVLGVVLTASMIWPSILILVIAFLIIKMLLRKIRCMPKSESSYGKLEPLALDLPKEYGVQLFTSESLCEYEFILRIVEFLSPFQFSGPPKVIANPKLLETYGDTFMQIAIIREVELYRRKTRLFTVLRLFTPLLLCADILLLLATLQVSLIGALPPAMQYFAPTILAVAVIIHGYFWNKSLSANDYMLDSYLLTLFSKKDIEDYIRSVDQLERRRENSKHTQLNDHYLTQRINRLNK